MRMPDTPLFVKTHDFLVWLLRHTQRFPRNLRHSYTVKLETMGFDFQEALLMANQVRGRDRMEWLERAVGWSACVRCCVSRTISSCWPERRSSTLRSGWTNWGVCWAPGRRGRTANHRGLLGCCGAAPGTTTPGTVGPPTATGTPPTTATTTTVFGYCVSSSSILPIISNARCRVCGVTC